MKLWDIKPHQQWDISGDFIISIWITEVRNAKLLSLPSLAEFDPHDHDPSRCARPIITFEKSPGPMECSGSEFWNDPTNTRRYLLQFRCWAALPRQTRWHWKGWVRPPPLRLHSGACSGRRGWSGRAGTEPAPPRAPTPSPESTASFGRVVEKMPVSSSWGAARTRKKKTHQPSRIIHTRAADVHMLRTMYVCLYVQSLNEARSKCISCRWNILNSYTT